METYIEYKEKIEQLTDLGDTLKALEKVSSAHIKPIKEKLKILNAYFLELETLLTYIGNDLKIQNTKNKRILLILTSDRGLLGGAWHNLFNKLENLNRNYDELHVSGKIGLRYMLQDNIKYSKSFIGISDDPKKEEVQQVLDYYIGLIRQKEISGLDILYLNYNSYTEYKPDVVQIYPLIKLDGKVEKLRLFLPIIEPNKKGIRDLIIEKYYQGLIEKTIYTNKLSELTNRTLNLEHASDTTTKFVYQTKEEYLKQKRNLTTQKQIESFTFLKNAK